MQSRPFGVALLVAGWQEGEGPVLYHTDPSGMFVQVRFIVVPFFLCLFPPII